jgi:tetratricopeptide (TPR) repeat protein|tara:strand:- start:263 stop:637 length:375 start_codon:yes stop_codon:yes gene_type:complete
MTGLFSYPKRKLRKLISQGEYEKAIEFGNELEAKNPKDPDLLFIMGSMFYILNDEKKTLHYIDRVLEINPYDVESLSLKLRVHQFLKEDDVVIDCCRKILEVAPDNFEVRDLISELESKDSSGI